MSSNTATLNDHSAQATTHPVASMPRLESLTLLQSSPAAEGVSTPREVRSFAKAYLDFQNGDAGTPFSREMCTDDISSQLGAAARAAHTAESTVVFLGWDTANFQRVFVSMAAQFMAGSGFAASQATMNALTSKSLAGTRGDLYRHFALVRKNPVSSMNGVQDFVENALLLLQLANHPFMLIELALKDAGCLKAVFVKPYYSNMWVSTLGGGYERHLACNLKKVMERDNTLLVLDTLVKSWGSPVDAITSPKTISVQPAPVSASV